MDCTNKYSSNLDYGILGINLSFYLVPAIYSSLNQLICE